MIVITGASGQLGRAITEQLLSRIPATQVGVSVRDPDLASDLAARGVRVRHGDFRDPGSLGHAFENARQVLIVSANASGHEALALHRTAIDAARAAGVQRILYTSHMGASPTSAFAPMPDHAETEGMLRESGVPFTSLRNGFYADSGVMLMGPAATTGTLTAPADGPVSWTTHADLAEAAAIILAQEGRFEGPTPPLTGSQALDLADLAAIATELTGRPIARVTVSDDEHRAALRGRGLPDSAADMLVGLFRASRNGEFAAVDPTLTTLLGRPPQTMQEVLRARLAATPA